VKGLSITNGQFAEAARIQGANEMMMEAQSTKPIYAVYYTKRNGKPDIGLFRDKDLANGFAQARRSITPKLDVRVSRIRVLSVEIEKWPCATL